MISAVLFISFFVFLILGVPIALCLGLSSVCAILYSGTSLTIVATNMYSAIRIYNGLLTCNFANGINFSNVLGISCELEMQEAGEGKPAYKIFAPGEVPPSSELPDQGS